MKIYVSNLKTSTERRKSIERQFAKLQLDYEFFDCVVGAELSDAYIEEQCNMELINQYNAKVEWFNRGIIGCTLTYKNIYREIVERNLDYALLLEDDIILSPDLKKILPRMEPQIRQGDVILLFYMSWTPLQIRKYSEQSIYGDYHFYQPVDAGKITGGSAMIITRKAAEKMLEVNTPVRTTPDDWGYYQQQGAIDRLLCVYPYCTDTGDFKSTMNTGRFSRLSHLVDKYRIPPFYQLIRNKRKKVKQLKQQIEILP